MSSTIHRMSFPDNFLRGITDKTLVTSDKMGVSASAFHFIKGDVDGEWLKQSICWEDDEHVIPLMQKQKKTDGKVKFKAGIARVKRQCVSLINTCPQTKDVLSYEREVLDDNNPYHGNLLLKKDTHNYRMKYVAAGIAMYVLEVITKE